MKDALKAELLSEQGNSIKATKYAKKNLENSCELTKILLYCEYKRELKIINFSIAKNSCIRGLI